MKEMNKRAERFFSQWEKKREKKWLFVFLHGSIYWGLPVGLGTFFLSSHFEIDNMSLSKLILSLATFMIGGIWFGLSQFIRIDSIYLGLNDQDEIKKGIQALKSGNHWNYENLKISKSKDEILNIQNQLIWFEEKDLTSAKIEECYKQVLEDFQRLKRNKDFELFSENRKVRFQIIDNSENESLLLEKFIS